MAKLIPLRPGMGAYEQAGLEEQMLRYLRPAGYLIGDIVRWMMPAASLTFPKPNRDVQHEFHAGASRFGLTAWVCKWTGSEFAVVSHNVIAYEGMSALQVDRAKRVLSGLRRRKIRSFLMKLSVGPTRGRRSSFVSPGTRTPKGKV